MRRGSHPCLRILSTVCVRSKIAASCLAARSASGPENMARRSRTWSICVGPLLRRPPWATIAASAAVMAAWTASNTVEFQLLAWRAARAFARCSDAFCRKCAAWDVATCRV